MALSVHYRLSRYGSRIRNSFNDSRELIRFLSDTYNRNKIAELDISNIFLNTEITNKLITTINNYQNNLLNFVVAGINLSSNLQVRATHTRVNIFPPQPWPSSPTNQSISANQMPETGGNEAKHPNEFNYTTDVGVGPSTLINTIEARPPIEARPAIEQDTGIWL